MKNINQNSLGKKNNNIPKINPQNIFKFKYHELKNIL